MGDKNSDDDVVVVRRVDLSMVYCWAPDITCLDAIHVHPLCWDEVLVTLLRLQRHCHLSRVTIMNASRKKMKGKKVTWGRAWIAGREGGDSGRRQRGWEEEEGGRSSCHLLSGETNVAVATYRGSKVVTGNDDDK
jgi:hypothetical protein